MRYTCYLLCTGLDRDVPFLKRGALYQPV
ncbi:hypothetical protein AZE42_11701 [Rhizopogon vesiculosus]|uniref:Uncharacterized protein n=1 Tax=Rhizopogon vesiculosus TaxID=180088 RepID=A0A1J8Q5B8_9AGAM|nr:hypothetical protein AZE42_11701 [Rhizopogon vesiculosus]